MSDFAGTADSVSLMRCHPVNLSCRMHRIVICELTSLISEFEEIFSEQPGKTPLVQYHIKLTPGAIPSRSAPYRLSPDKMNFIKEEIATLKEQGIVEDVPSDTTWAAPIVVVKKVEAGGCVLISGS